MRSSVVSEDRVAEECRMSAGPCILVFDIRREFFTERALKLGGFFFYPPPEGAVWSPTGINVPDYPKLAQMCGQADL